MDLQPLSLTVFLPAVVAALLLCTGRWLPPRVWHALGLLAALATFGCALPLWLHYDPVEGGFQFVQRFTWIESFGVRYLVGVDGISLMLVLLTTFLVPVVLLASWGAVTANVRAFVCWILLLETALLGAFASLNLFLFFVFSEGVLLPLFFLIGMWGGPLRMAAASRFVLFTAFGSSAMLVALAILGGLSAEQSGGTISFDWMALPGGAAPGLLDVSVPTAGASPWWRTQPFLFGVFFFAYAIRIPAVPLHGWLPSALSEAPAGVAALLAGVVLELGTYGLLRFAFPLFPEAVGAVGGLLFGLLGLGMLHASLAGFAQADLRRLAAYLSVVQLGLITLGVAAFNPQGLSGSVLHMVSHGVSSCALLLLLGFLYDRRRTLRIEELGGVARPMPVYAVAFGIVMLSLVGLPLSSGFAGEFLILLAAFDVSPWAAIVASLALAVLAAAMFRMYGRVLLGPVTNPENRGLIDLDWRERCVLLVLLVPILGLGVYPDPVLRRVEPAAIRILRQAEARSARVGAAPSAAAPVSPLAWPASWVRPADGLARHDVAGRGG